MAQRKNSEGLIIVISIIGLIIAAIACIAGWLALPQIQRFFEPPTITAPPNEVLKTETPIISSDPTETAVIEQPTTVPRPSPDPETQPGTILGEGKAWRQGDLELRLTSKEIYPHLVLAFFTLSNVGDVQRIFEFGQDNFSAVDNLGRQLDTGGVGWNFDPAVLHDCRTYSMILEPNASESFRLCGNWEGVAIAVDVTDNALTEIIITVSGISSIHEARWRIPINH